MNRTTSCSWGMVSSSSSLTRPNSRLRNCSLTTSVTRSELRLKHSISIRGRHWTDHRQRQADLARASSRICWMRRRCRMLSPTSIRSWTSCLPKTRRTSTRSTKDSRKSARYLAKLPSMCARSTTQPTRKFWSRALPTTRRTKTSGMSRLPTCEGRKYYK